MINIRRLFGLCEHVWEFKEEYVKSSLKTDKDVAFVRLYHCKKCGIPKTLTIEY